MSEMDKVITCQISFLSLGNEKVDLAVKKVIDIIESFNVNVRVGLLSTEIKGPSSEILKLIQEIVSYSNKHSKFVLDIKISNICGL